MAQCLTQKQREKQKIEKDGELWWPTFVSKTAHDDDERRSGAICIFGKPTHNVSSTSIVEGISSLAACYVGPKL